MRVSSTPPPSRRPQRGLPEHWLLPPAPREPEQAARWRALPFERRRTLARVRPEHLMGTGDQRPPRSTDGAPSADDAPPADAVAPGAPLSAADLALVVDLARARLATSWRVLAAGPVLGWLVLMTVWGFGRSTWPQSEERWLLAGLALGAVVWLLAALRGLSVLKRARTVLAVAGHPGSERADPEEVSRRFDVRRDDLDD